MPAHGDLTALNTLGLTATARLVPVTSSSELDSALSDAQSRGPIHVLGGGSNVLLQSVIPGTLLHMGIKGRSLRADDGRFAVVCVGAGENWHDFVLWCHHRGLHGLANLALIPGSVGAAPIQNIGAYGVEVAQWIRTVHVTDRLTGRRAQLSREACQFAYRDSVFKREEGAHWIVTAVEFALDRQAVVEAAYPSLRARLSDAPLSHDAVLAAVMSIRRERLPDPMVTPNVGSFFKNPLLSRAQADALAQSEPGLPVFPAPEGLVKVSAAWLIERLGWRGVERDGVKVSDDHALVLVGCGATSAIPWLALADDIRSSVSAAFGIRLELEPQLLGSPAEASVT
jgi:UDP-N-acetylmuramate dehydrogenase